MPRTAPTDVAPFAIALTSGLIRFRCSAGEEQYRVERGCTAPCCRRNTRRAAVEGRRELTSAGRVSFVLVEEVAASVRS